MDFTIITFKNSKNKFLENQINDLTKRFNSNINIVELKSFKDKNIDLIKQKEGVEISKLLNDKYFNYYKILLSENGVEFETKKLYDSLKIKNQKLLFVINGPYGYDKKIEKEFNLILSLSKMVMTSDISKLVLIEQLYRFYCFDKNIKYGK